jgi:hypothetical protein
VQLVSICELATIEPRLDGNNNMKEKTWSCVPNTNKIPFLAPAYDDHICPSKLEQWELRTNPLGCDISSTTTMTGIVSVTGTLVVVLLAFLAVLAAIRVRRYAAEKAQWPTALTNRWRSATSVCQPGPGSREEEPLLP